MLELLDACFLPKIFLRKAILSLSGKCEVGIPRIEFKPLRGTRKGVKAARKGGMRKDA